MDSRNTDTRRNPYLREMSERRQAVGAVAGRSGRGRGRQNARRRRRIRRQRIARLTVGFCAILLLFLTARGIGHLLAAIGERTVESSADPIEETRNRKQEALVQGIARSEYEKHPAWEEDFLTPNEYSRPGDALTEVNNIFVHYTANRNTSAAQNHSYFEQLKDTGERSASAHFIIGCDGEIIQCIPLDEIAYAVKTRNMDSISIECCYQSQDGSFTQETYDSLITLLRWLIDVYDLSPEEILRHYDCGGKKCPLYYVEHPDAWERLKKDVAGR